MLKFASTFEPLAVWLPIFFDALWSRRDGRYSSAKVAIGAGGPMLLTCRMTRLNYCQIVLKQLRSFLGWKEDYSATTSVSKCMFNCEQRLEVGDTLLENLFYLNALIPLFPYVCDIIIFICIQLLALIFYYRTSLVVLRLCQKVCCYRLYVYQAFSKVFALFSNYCGLFMMFERLGASLGCIILCMTAEVLELNSSECFDDFFGQTLTPILVLFCFETPPNALLHV